MTDAGSEPPNIEELVRRAQQKDELAFTILYTTYYKYLHCILKEKSHNDCTAEDLTHDTFLKAWRSLSTLKEPAAFKAWLVRIANNCFLDQQKRWQKLTTVELDVSQEEVSSLYENEPEQKFCDKEQFNEAFFQINIKYRQCLILYCIKGWSKATVARSMGIAESSVGKYIYRGREELNRIYDQMIEGEVVR